MTFEAATATVLAAGGDISSVVSGLAPNWGPFGALGNQARVIIQAVMAAVVVVCVIVALVGASKQRVGGGSRNNALEAEQGKAMFLSGLVGAFLVGSIGTIFTIVYGLGV